MVLSNSFYKKPLIKPLVSKIIYIVFMILKIAILYILLVWPHARKFPPCPRNPASYRLCHLLKSFCKNPLLKPLVSKITYIAFSYFQKLCCFAYIIIVIIIYNERLLNNTNHTYGKQTQVTFENRRIIVSFEKENSRKLNMGDGFSNN